MGYITTYTGKHIDPVHPDETLIDIKDIAHALSLICRGNGHVKHFYSVAQHCLACEQEAETRGQSMRIRMALLLHDAAEAYLCDLPSPVKNEMPIYRTIEDKLLNTIWAHFLGGVPGQEEQRVIWEIDKDMMSMDFHNLMAEEIDERYRKVQTHMDYTFRDQNDVEKEYLERFGELLSLLADNSLEKVSSGRKLLQYIEGQGICVEKISGIDNAQNCIFLPDHTSFNWKASLRLVRVNCKDDTASVIERNTLLKAIENYKSDKTRPKSFMIESMTDLDVILDTLKRIDGSDLHPSN